MAGSGLGFDPGASPPVTLSPTPFPQSCTTVTSSPHPLGPSHPPPTQEPSGDPSSALKRQRNTMAARRYRQKRVDRISELEGAVDQLTRERDELRLKLARQEAETAALREVLRMRPGGS